MKFPKKKKGLIIAGLLVAVFISLHYFIYIKVAEIPVITSYVSGPLNLEELKVKEIKTPNYFHPFRKVQYHYLRINEDGTYSDHKDIEQAKYFFARNFQTDIETISGNPHQFYVDFEHDGHGRPLIPTEYANIVFFIIQYLIIAAFAIILLRSKGTK